MAEGTFSKQYEAGGVAQSVAQMYDFEVLYLHSLGNIYNKHFIVSLVLLSCFMFWIRLFCACCFVTVVTTM